jgi:hypothetical protein
MAATHRAQHAGAWLAPQPSHGARRRAVRKGGRALCWHRAALHSTLGSHLTAWRAAWPPLALAASSPAHRHHLALRRRPTQATPCAGPRARRTQRGAAGAGGPSLARATSPRCPRPLRLPRRCPHRPRPRPPSSSSSSSARRQRPRPTPGPRGRSSSNRAAAAASWAPAASGTSSGQAAPARLLPLLHSSRSGTTPGRSGSRGRRSARRRGGSSSRSSSSSGSSGGSSSRGSSSRRGGSAGRAARASTSASASTRRRATLSGAGRQWVRRHVPPHAAAGPVPLGRCRDCSRCVLRACSSCGLAGLLSGRACCRSCRRRRRQPGQQRPARAHIAHHQVCAPLRPAAAHPSDQTRALLPRLRAASSPALGPAPLAPPPASAPAPQEDPGGAGARRGGAAA